MYKTVIGENAGKVWKYLYNTPATKSEFSEVKSGTGLSDLELAAAIGWLAREGKVEIDCEEYRDGEKKYYCYLMLNVYI